MQPVQEEVRMSDSLTYGQIKDFQLRLANKVIEELEREQARLRRIAQAAQQVVDDPLLDNASESWRVLRAACQSR